MSGQLVLASCDLQSVKNELMCQHSDMFYLMVCPIREHCAQSNVQTMSHILLSQILCKLLAVLKCVCWFFVCLIEKYS